MEINRKIDLQVASLKTVLESLKLETIRYLAGKKLVSGSGDDGGAWLKACPPPPQRPSSPAWPSLWASTGCGGEETSAWRKHQVLNASQVRTGSGPDQDHSRLTTWDPEHSFIEKPEVRW